MRRRLFWMAALLAAAGTAGGLIAFIPNSTPGTAAPTHNEGPAQVVTQSNVRLTRADRRSIDDLLAKFVPAAVERHSATQAWALAGPELKASSTLAQWKAGNSPVPYYPAKKQQNLTGWPTVDVERNQVTLSLLVHPKTGTKLGDYTFSVQTIRQHGRWLVNRFYTVAINNPVRNGQHEVGPADFQAPGAGSGAPASKPRLGHSWLLPVVAVLSLALLIPFGLGLAVFVRARRRRRQQAADPRNVLPPLPSGSRSD